MKYLSIIAVVVCLHLLACNKGAGDSNVPNKDTTKVPIDTSYDRARLFGTWELRSTNVAIYKNSVLSSTNNQMYAAGSMRLSFIKEDSLIVQLHDTLYDAKFSISKNVIFSNPKTFNGVLLDSMTFQFDTYKLGLSTEQKSIDSNKDTIKVLTSYLLTP